MRPDVANRKEGGKGSIRSFCRLAPSQITLFTKWVLREARNSEVGVHAYLGSKAFSQPPHLATFSSPPRDSTMTDNSLPPKGRDGAISALNIAIDGLNVAKEALSSTLAGPVFGPVASLLTMIRVSSFLFRDETLQAHTYLGYDGQQTGIR